MKDRDLMTNPARRWKERQELLASRKPRVRIDSARVMQGEKGYYDVVIEGFGMRPAFSPPIIKVGGVRLEEARFSEGGRRTTGVLREKPRDDSVIVDLIYASAEGQLKPRSSSK